VHETERVILRANEAFRRGDIGAVLRCWHADGVLKPMSSDRRYRGRDEIQSFLEDAKRSSRGERLSFDTVLQADDYALMFGTDEAGESAFWVAEVAAGKLKCWEGFRNVREAFEEFRERRGPR
jgi:ketosteroid isomerase-like protein